MVIDKVKDVIKEEGLILILADEVKNLPVSIRPLYLCKYGCPEYGIRPSCPPFTGSFDDIRLFIESYRLFMLVTTKEEFSEDFLLYKRNFQEKLINIQKKLLQLEFYYAFSLFPGSCSLCKKCGMPETCYCREDVRPSVSAMGIELMRYLQQKASTSKEVNIYLHTRRLFSIILLE